MEIHYTDLASIYPSTAKATLEASLDPLSAAMNRFDISTGSRAAAFIAQAGHESGGFAHMIENLNYGAQGLRTTFGKYFTTVDLANAYARQPQKIANRVYANRMGNGNEASGDGWKYRGRGFIQLTGKDNYARFATAMGISLDKVIAYLETTEGAAMSAGWFWDSKSLNTLADQGNFKAITIRINGGTNGWEDRLAHFQKAKNLFG